MANEKVGVTKAKPHEAIHFASLVSVREVPGKGLGVFAEKDLDPWMKVAVYPGYVYKLEDYDKLEEAGKTSDIYGFTVQGVSGRKYVIDPAEADGSGQIPRKFEGSIGHRVNEPSGRKKTNVSLVENFTIDDSKDHPQLEYWTNRVVKKGAELVAYYNEAYPGRHDYKLSEAAKKNKGGYVMEWKKVGRKGKRSRVWRPSGNWIGESTSTEDEGGVEKATASSSRKGKRKR